MATIITTQCFRIFNELSNHAYQPDGYTHFSGHPDDYSNYPDKCSDHPDEYTVYPEDLHAPYKISWQSSLPENKTILMGQ